MFNIRVSCLLALSLCAGLTTLRADTFNFSYMGPGITASGTLTAVADGGGKYTVTGITGTRNGATITGLVPAGSDGILVWDDFLFLGGGNLVDSAGLAFDVQGVTGPVNVCYGNVPTTATCVFNNVVSYYDITETAAGGFTPVALTNFTVSPVPEPSMIFGPLMLGLAVLGSKISRRRHNS